MYAGCQSGGARVLKAERETDACQVIKLGRAEVSESDDNYARACLLAYQWRLMEHCQGD